MPTRSGSKRKIDCALAPEDESLQGNIDYLELLSEPGSVMMSAVVREEIAGRLMVLNA